jgi:hypothetical protein
MNQLPAHTPGPVQRTIAVVLFLLPVALMLSSGRVQDSLICMQFMWLLCGTLLALDLVFFLAAWRRGFRWFFSRRALRFHAWVAMGCVSFVLLYYMEESWRGKRAWAALQREAAGRGESLEFKLPAPPATPDEQNFIKAPGIAELFSTNMPDWWNGGAFYHGREHEWPAGRVLLSWSFQQSTDLAAWQKYFRDRAGKSSAENVRPEDLIFPATPEPQSPAADVLLALSRFETNLATLRAASSRPALHLSLDYGKGFFAVNDLYRAVVPLRFAAHLLALRRAGPGADRGGRPGYPARLAPGGTPAGGTVRAHETNQPGHGRALLPAPLGRIGDAPLERRATGRVSAGPGPAGSRGRLPPRSPERIDADGGLD